MKDLDFLGYAPKDDGYVIVSADHDAKCIVIEPVSKHDVAMAGKGWLLTHVPEYHAPAVATYDEDDWCDTPF